MGPGASRSQAWAQTAMSGEAGCPVVEHRGMIAHMQLPSAAQQEALGPHRGLVAHQGCAWPEDPSTSKQSQPLR